jgi:FkbM family methyltransferase
MRNIIPRAASNIPAATERLQRPFADGPRWPKPGTHRARRTWLALALASEFTARWRFSACEIIRFDGRARSWALRSGGVVVLRSGTSDIDIFAEIYGSRIYDPPPQVRAALSREPVRIVADLGANVGVFAVRTLEEYRHAHVISFEPDPWNVAVARACRKRSRHRSRWTIRPIAAGALDAVVPFLSGRFAVSRAALPSELGTPGVMHLPMEDALPVLREADFIKIDIEGGEWPILQDGRFADVRARALVIEYHPEHSPGPDAYGEACRLLVRAGYLVARGVPEAEAVGQLWAWRP